MRRWQSERVQCREGDPSTHWVEVSPLRSQSSVRRLVSFPLVSVVNNKLFFLCELEIFSTSSVWAVRKKIDFSRRAKFMRNLIAKFYYWIVVLTETSEESFMAYGRNPLKFSTIKAVFFDLDNTLVPTRKADVLCMRKVMMSLRWALSTSYSANLVATHTQLVILTVLIKN